MSKSIMSKCVVYAVELLGKEYNFDVEEALKKLNVDVKKVEKVEKVEKCKYPLPFNGEKNENLCKGIVKNHGLYTQCGKKVKGYCKGCESQPYGNIDDRLKVDLYEYKDPKGKSPKRYMEVLKSLKISKETIEEEVKRLNITINAIHFEEAVALENVKRGRPKSEKKVKETTGKKGRPKKENKTVEISKDIEEDDLFATLIAKANAQADQPLEKVEPNPEEDVIVEELKEEPKDLAAPLPKVDKKQKKAEEKAAKEAAKEAEKQKKAEEKAAKEAAKEAEKQKKAEEKAAKEAAKESKKKTPKVESKDLAPPLVKVDEEEVADVVKKFEFEGKSYYKSKKSSVIYNMEQEVVGKWNEERKEIEFEEEEEEEEEYDD